MCALVAVSAAGITGRSNGWMQAAGAFHRIGCRQLRVSAPNSVTVPQHFPDQHLQHVGMTNEQITDQTSEDPTSKNCAARSETGGRSRRRVLAITAGAFAGAVALTGGVYVAGSGLATATAATSSETHSPTQVDTGASAESKLERGASPRGGDRSVATLGAESAHELSQAIALAAGVNGLARGIEAHGPGSWLVTVDGGASREKEVLVHADGSVDVLEIEVRDSDDRQPAGSLDPASLASVVRAALAVRDGRVIEVELDDELDRPFDVKIQGKTGHIYSLELTGDFRVVDIDVD